MTYTYPNTIKVISITLIYILCSQENILLLLIMFITTVFMAKDLKITLIS
jgi:hypothetical protein